MTTKCNNLCLRLKVIPPYGEPKYLHDRKFCRYCNCFLVTEQNRCICCKLSLRNKSRMRKDRWNFSVMIIIQNSNMLFLMKNFGCVPNTILKSKMKYLRNNFQSMKNLIDFAENLILGRCMHKKEGK